MTEKSPEKKTPTVKPLNKKPPEKKTPAKQKSTEKKPQVVPSKKGKKSSNELETFNKTLSPKPPAEPFLYSGNTAIWEAAEQLQQQIPKPDSKVLPPPEFKEDPKPEDEPNTVNLSNTDAETASIPKGEPTTPAKKAVDKVNVEKTVDAKKKPIGKQSVDNKTQLGTTTPTMPPQEKKVDADAISVPSAQPESPKRQAESIVSVPPAKPLTPKKLQAEIAEPPKKVTTEKPKVKPVIKPTKLNSDKKVVEPKLVKPKPSGGSKITPSKVSVEPSKPSVKGAVPQPKPSKLPEKSSAQTEIPKKRPVIKSDDKISPRGQPPPKTSKKYGVEADMQRSEEIRRSRDLPNGRVIPFGYRSPQKSTLSAKNDATTPTSPRPASKSVAARTTPVVRKQPVPVSFYVILLRETFHWLQV